MYQMIPAAQRNFKTPLQLFGSGVLLTDLMQDLNYTMFCGTKNLDKPIYINP